MAGINQGNMKDFIGEHVYYLTGWGHEGEGRLTHVLGMAHVEIEESEGDSIITSIGNVFTDEQQRTSMKRCRERLMAMI